MKTGIILLTVGTLFSQILCAPFSFDAFENGAGKPLSRTAVETDFCRLYSGTSKCVDEPLPIWRKEKQICPYRMCAPSYVPAELCPADNLVQATDKCKVEEFTRDIYQCTGNWYGYYYVPIGCSKGTPGCDYVPTCSCVKVEDYTSKVLKPIAPFKPDCQG